LRLSCNQIVRRAALLLGSAATLAPVWLLSPDSLLAQSGYPTSYKSSTPMQATLPYFNRNVIVLDPAHGGQDAGATLNGHALEKDVTLALAASLRATLTARGFTVVSTRDSDLTAAAPLLTGDQRAGTANHLRPVACIVLHATASGNGLSLSTSSLPLQEAPSASEPSAPIPWDTAQSLYLPQSLRLANDLGLALLRAKLPVQLLRTTLKPLDNLTCPAVALEVAPLVVNGSKPTPVTDAGYQQRIADTLAGAILNWRDLMAPKPVAKPAPTPTSGGNP